MLCYILIAALVGTAQCGVVKRNVPKEDEITNLPGLKKMPENFKMYSGYLNTTNQQHMHYWFNEQNEENKSYDRLIIWFNGGPGCSSLDGLFVENGPVMFDKHGSVVENPYSWNILAATLYIEMPVNVGFSYSDLPDEKIHINDSSVAADTYVALKDFFNKFPDYKKSKIYITGESYAGVYIPMLALSIIEGDAEWMKGNLKGLLIGNGLLNEDLNDASLIYFAYYHNLIGKALWDELLENCCKDDKSDICMFHSGLGEYEQCLMPVSRVRHKIYNEGLNFYNLYQDCENSVEQPKHQDSSNNTYEMEYTQEDEQPEEQEELVPTCQNGTLITNYLNRANVKEALHVKDKTWSICNQKVITTYGREQSDMSDEIQKIITEGNNDIRIVLYYGDVDLACNALGGEWFFDRLEYPLTQRRRIWKVENEAGIQVAGYYKEKHRIQFVTFKGAGHMVPTDKPFEMMEMLKRYFNEKPY